MTETHTYPDGSARVGAPPFPRLSPMEEAAGKKEPEQVKEPVKKAAAKDKVAETEKPPENPPNENPVVDQPVVEPVSTNETKPTETEPVAAPAKVARKPGRKPKAKAD